MCEGRCQGVCRRNGRDRPESCRRQVFTPLTVDISMSTEGPSIETSQMPVTMDRPTSTEAAEHTSIAA